MSRVDHIQGWGLIGCIRAVSRIWGRRTIDKFWPYFSEISREYLSHQVQSSSSYPLAVATDLVAQVERAFGNGNGSAAEQFGDAVGRLAVETVFVVYMGSGETERAFNALPRAWKKVYPNTSAQAEIVASSDKGGVLHFAEFIEGREMWIPFWVGWFRGYMETSIGSGDPVRVRAVEDGPSVEFHLSLLS